MNIAEHKETIHKYLQDIVDEFNKNYGTWGRVMSCSANFKWKYEGENKTLAIDRITMDIFSDQEEKEKEVKRAEDILSTAEPFEIEKP